ncbi:uncharacterized protein LOC119846466 isoform X3 [Dermochelys coriacea]|uniref:uncharacterized protein LOC119846466 isoform X3 n=1 Tax=Dermochelys coriacea TaxID=27794 RepID=UPI001CA9ABA1|nr:uncharacterized protein LOC119846466 isoform X3 [Dermochelys coriacea]
MVQRALDMAGERREFPALRTSTPPPTLPTFAGVTRTWGGCPRTISRQPTGITDTGDARKASGTGGTHPFPETLNLIQLTFTGVTTVGAGHPRTIRSQPGGRTNPGGTRKASGMGGTWEQGFFPRKYGRGWKHHRGPFRGGYWGKFDPHYHRIQSCSSREKFKSSRSSASRSPERCSASSRKKSVSSKTEKAKTAAPKKPGKSKKDSTAPVEVPKLPQVHAEASQTATDPSSQAGSALDTEPPESPETTEDLYPMRTEGTELGHRSVLHPQVPSCPGTVLIHLKSLQVQLGASLEVADNHSQAGCTLATDSVLADTPEDLCLPEEEIEMVQLEASHEATDRSSQAGSDLAAEPPAPPETTEELHPIRTEDTELLQLEDNLKASDLLSQAVSALATLPPVWSEITEELPPVGKEEIELINLLPSPCLKSTQEQLAAHQEEPYQACSALAAPSETMEYLRSAAILARKEEIELSYQQSSLAFAVVATMLLQKEPSMEAAMGSALRANLRQVGGHCLQELEHFIRSYDSGSARL